MRTFFLTPEGSPWILTDGSNPIATYANKADALRGAAKRVSKEFGALVIRRPDGTVEEERRYPPRNGLEHERSQKA
ncbi:MAG TPA: DUF2188 domain-containing protein [Verrucomicrobiales bacterium]|nr:DUF2188 domain-containing protein [Verrucomicrobiales bacterium]